MEVKIIKEDVINELRNQRYYNEQEISRLVVTETISHKQKVNEIISLVKENVQLIESVKLMDLYFPVMTPQQVSPVVPSSQTPE